MTAVILGPAIFFIRYPERYDGFKDLVGVEIIFGMYSLYFSSLEFCYSARQQLLFTAEGGAYL